MLLDTSPILVVKKRSDLTSIEINAWNDLWRERQASLFCSYDWVKSCENTIEQWKRLIIVLGYQKNKLVFVLPLVLQKILFLSIAYSPNRKFLDQSCILFCSDLLLSFFIAKVKDVVKNLILYEVSESLKEKILQQWVSVLIAHASTSFSLDLQNVKEAYNFSKKSIKELFRLQRQGNFQLEILPTCEVDPVDIFNFEAISAKAWTSKAIFHQIKYQKFFIEIMKLKYLKIYILKKENEVVALDICWVLHWVAFSLYRAYLPKYRKYSPWNILQYNQIQEIKKDKLFYYHLYRGDTYQKRRFANVKYGQYNLYFFSNSLLKTYFKFTLWLKKVYIWFKCLFKGLLKKLLSRFFLIKI